MGGQIRGADVGEERRNGQEVLLSGHRPAAEASPRQALWRVTAPGVCRLLTCERQVVELLGRHRSARLAFLGAGGWHEVEAPARASAS